jgi:hypothetical protein
MEIVAAAFTDHFVAALRLTLGMTPTSTRKGHWKMNTSFLEQPSFHTTLKESWTQWQHHIKY